MKPGPTKGTKFADISRTPFGNRLYSILKTRNISQRELSAKIGISNRMISYYAVNEYGPPLGVLKKIAATLNVTISYLADESPLKTVELDDTNPAIKKDIEIYKQLPRKDQRTVSNMIHALNTKNQLQQKENDEK